MKVDRDAIKRQYGTLFQAVSRALLDADPMDIDYGINPDEYEPEAATIVPRLDSAGSVQDIETIVHEEFCRWFGQDTAGPKSKYVDAAARVWAACRAYARSPSGAS